MTYSQKWGGIAALVAAGTYIVGFVLMFTVLDPAGFRGPDSNAAADVAFLMDNALIMYVWNMIIYVLNAVMLVVLALAIHDRLKAGAPALSQTATAFALIWAGLVLASGMLANITIGAVTDLAATDAAGAATLWTALATVENGLGGGNEITGGLWVLLLSAAALKAEALSRPLVGFGALIGVAGLATVIPGLSEIGGAIFGLGFIVWFVWIGGIVMLIGAPRVAGATPAAA